MVKFMNKYNTQAHHLLADEGYTPELLFAGLTPGCPAGGMMIIVMELVTQAPLASLHDEICPTLKPALDILHSTQFVFGDLREPNTLVPANRSGKQKQVTLIDFD
ncbi:hypothetical protein CTheo_7667 [Ceratobasidium theobromae]|uniref:Protein kinase domain-containing protein n=1 Tax=Ceratobasidium theobromae TaxID=1582974 RepID=A0A5N5QBU7_9AGAM|nr:hypothetical protein CTheo_7667 [Ceratobasidium theobromae]